MITYDYVLLYSSIFILEIFAIFAYIFILQCSERLSTD